MEVTISAAKTLISKAVNSASRQPIMMHSSAGIGKSSIIKQICEYFGWLFIDVRLSSMESSDVQGIPYVYDGVSIDAAHEVLFTAEDKYYAAADILESEPNNKIFAGIARRAKAGLDRAQAAYDLLIKNDKIEADMKFSTPSWFPTDPDAVGILFFDEISNASIDVQKASYRVILDRQVQNGKTLPKGIKVVAAGNLKKDKTGAKDLVPALANRFGMHLTIKASVKDFQLYGVNKGLSDKVLGFLDWKPDAIHRFDPAKNEHAYATPRSWEAMSDNMNVGFDDEELAVVTGGCVGENTSHEFLTYLRYFDKLPSMESIANGSLKYNVDASDRGLTFALTSSLMAAARENLDSDTKITNLWEVVKQLDDEFIALIYRNLKQADETYLIKLVKNTMDTWKRVSKRIA